MNQNTANNDLRTLMFSNRVTQWMLADQLGVSENTVARMLRHELTGEKKEMVVDAIKACKAKQEKEVSA